MKQILVITYHFAPELATGAIRANKFCEFLPEFGWRPTVLSVDSRQYTATDPDGPPPAIRIVRTSIRRSPRQLLLRARDACSRLRPFTARNGLRRSGEEQAHDHQVTSSSAANGSRGQLRHEALALLTVLDDQVGWVPPAFRAASRLLSQHRIDAILTSGPPHSTHVIGLLLKRRFGVPWVADLRDPWSLQAMGMLGATKLSRALELHLEALVVRRADLVLTTASRLSQAMRRVHAGVPPERFQTVTNGFDREDFAVADELPPHFAVAHVGNLFFRLSPRQVIRAWCRLLDDQRLPRGRARFTFLGDCDPELDPAAMAREAGLGDMISVAPRVPPAQAIRTMLQSDLLLAFCQDLPLAIPSKIFDYLASGADILALAPDGALADLLASVGRGTVVPPDDTDAIAAALERSWHAYQRGETRSRPRPATADPTIAAFERRALTRVLAGHLDRICC
jgi:glycosyltransferase involved in cell wall biosynthesis